jgi:hypothetical protein
MLKKNGVATARFKINLKLGQVAHTCCPHSWEVEVGASRVQSQPQLHCKFEARLAIWDPASKAKKKKKKKKKKENVCGSRSVNRENWEFVIQGRDAETGAVYR